MFPNLQFSVFSAEFQLSQVNSHSVKLPLFKVFLNLV